MREIGCEHAIEPGLLGPAALMMANVRAGCRRSRENHRAGPCIGEVFGVHTVVNNVDPINPGSVRSWSR
jgi:hypothetical protein